jgi:protein-tyrosine-phosphatase
MSSERAPDVVPTTFNILFVCTGNTCRSPMAEGIAAAELARRGWSHVAVGSAGTGAEEGSPAADHAVAALARRGVDLTTHRSRLLTRELVEWADVVLAMSPSHLDAIARLGGAERMALLGEFAAGTSGGWHAVPDPFGGDEATYEQTLQALEALVGHALDRLAPILQP